MSDHRLYTPHATEDCSCPIHADGHPPIVPLGIAFSHQVSVSEIDAGTAEAIYEAHHSYMPSLPDVNICHHGIEFRGELVGAISYRQPLIGRLKLGIDADGRIHRDFDGADTTEMVSGGTIAEVNRICVGVPMRNLASCGLAASQDRFVRDHADRLDLEWLLTFIRADHTGAMLKALSDKGWQLAGVSEPRQAGNRPDKEIREHEKYRWIHRITDHERLPTRMTSANQLRAVGD